MGREGMDYSNCRHANPTPSYPHPHPHHNNNVILHYWEDGEANYGLSQMRGEHRQQRHLPPLGWSS